MKQTLRIAILILGVSRLVEPQRGPVRLELHPSNPVVIKGTSQQLSAVRIFRSAAGSLVIQPEAANTAIWTSSAPSVATVAPGGILTALQNGTTTITAQTGPFRGYTTVTVVAAVPQITSIEVLPSSPSAPLGLNVRLYAMGHFGDGSTHEITSVATWTASDSSKASVSTGVVSTKAEGTVNISAAAGGAIGAAPLTIGPPAIVVIDVQPSNATLIAGNQQAFTATGHYTNASTQDVTSSTLWSSGDPTIARMDSGGMAFGIAAGTVGITAVAGNVSGGAPLSVTQTYQQDSRLFLRSVAGTELTQVGLETRWGGAIVEVSVNGNNYVNAFDDGREIQLALYDNKPPPTCSSCDGADGWNPVQGGDGFRHDSGILVQDVQPASLYVKTRPLHWNPVNNGGSETQPVPADVFFEQWLYPVAGHPRTFRLHYKVTHFGLDFHVAQEEFPAVYLNVGYDTLAYYSGNAPWTNDLVTLTPVPFHSPTFEQYCLNTEKWQALVNFAGDGVTVFTPNSYPFAFGIRFAGAGGTTGFGASYMRPIVAAYVGPQAELESDVYFIAGGYTQARSIVGQLRQIVAPDVFSVLGYNDTPTPNQVLGGTIPVGGWVFDSRLSVTEILVLVDGSLAGRATYGLPRPDVGVAYPTVNNAGYQFLLDTHAYANGFHTILVRVTDTKGKTSDFSSIPVTITN